VEKCVNVLSSPSDKNRECLERFDTTFHLGPFYLSTMKKLRQVRNHEAENCPRQLKSNAIVNNQRNEIQFTEDRKGRKGSEAFVFAILGPFDSKNVFVRRIRSGVGDNCGRARPQQTLP
jgi:hypothetical protein